MKPRIVFFGNEILATVVDYKKTPLLDSLLVAGWPIAALVIKLKPGRKTDPKPAIIAKAKAAGLKVIIVKNSQDLEAIEWRELDSRLGFVAGFGLKISKNIIDHFSQGLVNIHPSLLPKHRGKTPIESAIIKNDGRTGFSLMQISPNWDAGPIYYQSGPIASTGLKKLELTTFLAKEASQILTPCLLKIAKGQLQPKPQDEAKASNCLDLKKVVDLDSRQSARYLERQIRAQHGWPGTWLTIEQLKYLKIKIIKAKAVNIELEPIKQVGELVVNQREIYYICRDGQLKLELIQPVGKKILTAREFINGHLVS